MRSAFLILNGEKRKRHLQDYLGLWTVYWGQGSGRSHIEPLQWDCFKGIHEMVCLCYLSYVIMTVIL